jgi:hypothetical protein
VLVNRTGRDLRLMARDTPDRIPAADIDRWTVATLPAHDGEPARIGEIDLGHTTWEHGGDGDWPIAWIEYRHVTDLPAPRPGVSYVVSHAVAMMRTYQNGDAGRGDLLVVHRRVRDETGVVVGCRWLARPV